ncbi:MAG: hypothetical protein J0I06_23805 [Planctomycetes bacterium]|nr:hypothetical protein [Planctomycetota bacterium]
MNATPTHADAPDELDRLFSEFFKAQLKRPWPNAPVPAAASTTKSAEPSELVTARAQEAPRNAPMPARRDSSSRARFTLAASVALMLGTCWYLSNGFQPGARSGPGTPSTPSGPGMLPDSGASAPKGGVLDTINKNKATDNGGKMDMGKFE